MNARIQDRYVTDTVETMSPGRLLVRLFDRLVTDLQRGEQAITDGAVATAHEQLVHAQDILTELLATLRLDAWEGASGLAQIYGYARSELVAANVNKDAERVAAARSLIEPLRDAWRAALEATEASPASMSA